MDLASLVYRSAYAVARLFVGEPGAPGKRRGAIGLRGAKSVVPDLTRKPTAAVPLQGAQGPLSAKRSAAKLEQMERGVSDTGIFDGHPAREEAIASGPSSTSNRVRLLQDHPGTDQAMLAAILSARDHINLETYILDDDDVGRRFAQALMDKRRPGVLDQSDPRQRRHTRRSYRMF